MGVRHQDHTIHNVGSIQTKGFIIVIESTETHSREDYGEQSTYESKERKLSFYQSEDAWRSAVLRLYEEDANRTDVWAFQASSPLRPKVTLELSGGAL